MPDALDEQIEAYEALLPEIKKSHGSVWVLVADRKLVSTFKEFSAAVRYANSHYGPKAVLIRHTDERTTESAPFVQTRGA
jgi:hypothetical protein